MDRELVLTGACAITPAGDAASVILDALLEGDPVTAEQAPPPVSFDGLPIARRDARRLTRADALAVAAAGRAATESGFACDPLEAERAALFLGTSKDLGSYDEFLELLPEIPDDADEADVLAAIVDRATGMMSPFFLLDCMPNLAMHYVATMFGIRGENCCFTVLGCAGAEAVAQAAAAIGDGRADVGIAGGFDRLTDPLNQSRLLAQWFLAEDPAEADGYRPHEPEPGFPIFADGAGALVLEERRHALARDAAIRGRLLGIGSAFSPQPPYGEPSAAAILAAARSALAQAGLEPGELAFVVASGQGAPRLDDVEAAALGELLAGTTVPVTAWKGGLGHLLSAAAPVELAVAFECLELVVVAQMAGAFAPATGPASPVAGNRGGVPRFLVGSPARISGSAAMLVSLGLRGQAHAFILGRKDT